jgi:UDP-N-acetylmuramoyl-tripeptide--D-alanyl-D-alanine ligase
MAFISTAELYSHFLAHPVVSTDTRTISPGCIFFALKGGNFNGNRFAQEAIAKGAAYAVIDEAEFSAEKTLPVPDVLKALQDLARMHRQELGKKGLNVFGLTGSNGKTTTKELLARVLSRKFRTLYTQGNLNNHIGVPLTLLRLDDSHEMAVIEMGANHQQEIAELSAIALPQFGLITNVGLAHLEGFGGPEGVLKGKSELFDHLALGGGTAFVLADDTRLLERSARMKRMTYGTQGNADVNGVVTEADPFVCFEWEGPGTGKHIVRTQMVGAYNLPNLLAACAVGTYFGISPAEIGAALSRYAPSNNRSQAETRGTNRLILDCYNANPSSMAAAIDNMAAMEAGKKILVLGDMFELGESSAEEHQRVVDRISAKLPDATTLLVGKNFSATKDTMGAVRLADAAAAAEWLKQHLPEYALILVKGSRGMKMEQCAEVL